MIHDEIVQPAGLILPAGNDLRGIAKHVSRQALENAIQLLFDPYLTNH